MEPKQMDQQDADIASLGHMVHERDVLIQRLNAVLRKASEWIAAVEVAPSVMPGVGDTQSEVLLALESCAAPWFYAKDEDMELQKDFDLACGSLARQTLRVLQLEKEVVNWKRQAQEIGLSNADHIISWQAQRLRIEALSSDAAALRAELHHLTTCGVIEVMLVNPNVNSWVKEQEARLGSRTDGQLKAEDELQDTAFVKSEAYAALLTERDELRASYAYIQDQWAEEATALTDELRDACAVIEKLLQSANPTESEHPTMAWAWKEARAYLESREGK